MSMFCPSPQSVWPAQSRDGGSGGGEGGGGDGGGGDGDTSAHAPVSP